MKFIDLFAGLGGFHIGLTELGHECVFACDIDSNIADLYEKNYGIQAHGDIKKIKVEDIPSHDILCAGFPCQPFSKAGRQHGLNDERGTLFLDDIARIIKFHNPKYIILENVQHIMQHDGQKTWNLILTTLQDELGYNIKYKVLSPHEFGIPQIRKRVFIVASKDTLNHFTWPDYVDKPDLDIRDILDTDRSTMRKVPEREMTTINLWQKLLDLIPPDEKIPSFPIWAAEYKATYPFEAKSPFATTAKELNNSRGAFGVKLKDLSKRNQIEALPTYARDKVGKFPEWKKFFIRENRKFFKKYEKQFAPVMKELYKLPPSWQKLEWNCQGEERNLSNYILQFRASGIRVKRTKFSPSLIASTATQVPIVAWEGRYMTVREAAKLQSMENIEMPENITASFKALGNAVNARLVYLVAKNLLQEAEIMTDSQIESINIQISPRL